MNLPRPSTSNSSSLNLIWLIAGGLAIVLGGLLISTFAPLILPQQASAESRQVDDLFRFMLAIGGMIFLLVQGMLVVSIIFFRANANEMTDGPYLRGNAMLELVWTVIPAILVTVIAIYAFQVWTSTHSIKPNEQLVGAVGARYAWTFNYDLTADTLPADVTPDQLAPEIQAALANGMSFSSAQLHTWVNQPVAVSMQTNDVNHAFWIPAMRVKQDLLAGRTTEVRFTPIEAGVYRIVCAELCGSGHGNMAGTVGLDGTLQGAWLIVHPDEETYLREFYNPLALAVLFPPDDPVELGRALLAGGKYPCAACHALTDLGWAGNIGPNLNGIGNRAGNRVGGQDGETYLHNSLRHPGDYLVPGYGNLMPQFNPNPDQSNYMPDADLDAIVSYLLSQTGS